MELIPMVAFLKSYKNEGLPSHLLNPPSYSPNAQQRDWTLAGPIRVAAVFLGCATSWYFIWMHVALSTDAKAITQSALVGWCLGCIPGHSKKWSVQENKIYLLFLIKWCTVAQVMHIKRRGCFVTAFQGYRQRSIINISVIDILHTCYMFTIAFIWQAIHTILSHPMFLLLETSLIIYSV